MPYILLGRLDVARELVDRAMLEANAREVQHLWPKAATNRAGLDVVSGDAPAALASLDATRDSGDVLPLEDLAVVARVRAQTLSDAGGAPARAVAARRGVDR